MSSGPSRNYKNNVKIFRARRLLFLRSSWKLCRMAVDQVVKGTQLDSCDTISTLCHPQNFTKSNHVKRDARSYINERLEELSAEITRREIIAAPSSGRSIVVRNQPLARSAGQSVLGSSSHVTRHVTNVDNSTATSSVVASSQRSSSIVPKRAPAALVRGSIASAPVTTTGLAVESSQVYVSVPARQSSNHTANASKVVKALVNPTLGSNGRKGKGKQIIVQDDDNNNDNNGDQMVDLLDGVDFDQDDDEVDIQQPVTKHRDPVASTSRPTPRISTRNTTAAQVVASLPGPTRSRRAVSAINAVVNNNDVVSDNVDADPARLSKPPTMKHPWSRDVGKALRQRFGLQGFRQNQEEAINATLSGRDVFVLLPTGGGKSLCFQLPAVVSSGKTHGVTIVVSPLLSLISDQCKSLFEKDIPVVYINSQMGKGDREFAMSVLRSDPPTTCLAYVTPELVSPLRHLRIVVSLTILLRRASCLVFRVSCFVG